MDSIGSNSWEPGTTGRLKPKAGLGAFRNMRKKYVASNFISGQVNPMLMKILPWQPDIEQRCWMRR